MEAFDDLNEEAAYEVLKLIRKKWRYLNAARRYYCWPHVIEPLVEKIRKSKTLKARFKKEFKKIFAIKPLDSGDFRSLYRRRTAVSWHKKNKPGFELVASELEPLGVKLLEDACEAAGGYPVVRQPDSLERKKIAKLINAAKEILPPCFISENISKCEVFDEREGTTLGLAKLSKYDNYLLTKLLVSKARKMKCGECKEKICGFNSISKYKLKGVELNSKILNGKDLSGALAVYIHELAHIYGEDGSDKFGRALERAIWAIIDKA